jgi:RNA polymerase sigma factor (sigma-70 family)
MKFDPDTQIGGARSAFPATEHSAVRSMASPDASERVRGYERLVAAYWKPVYKYIRIKWNMANEEAKDLTQGFFTRAIERDYFREYDSDKGSFRTYLRTCLDGFLSNERQYSGRLKRSAGLVSLDMDFETAEGELRRSDASTPDSFEEYFDKEWTRALFAASLDGLREDCASRGKEIQARLFERYELDGDPEITYDQLAAEFGISVTAVTNHLAAARRTFRRVVVEKLREITAGEREFRSEARRLGIDP